ncbi:MAG: acyltransferase family protein, partial [Clostridiales bacterium]|nr:acyltransferase family protein [Clostridiales bacterium]
MENSSISETGERNNTLQILRGLAITAVLLHHTISKTGGGSVLKGIDDILICFHMPAFFIIAGYLYQIKLDKYEKAGKISFIKGKAKHLLIPYAFWTILLWGGVNLANKAGSSVSRMLTEIGFGPMSVKDLAIGLLTYEENYYYTEHLWFLYVLFLFFFIHCLMGKRGKGKISLLLGLAAGFLTCYVDMPNIAERFMLWIVFFIFGRYMAYEEKLKYWIDNKSKNMWILFVLLFA